MIIDTDQLLKKRTRVALEHIDFLWSDLQRTTPHDDATLIGLPHPYIVPSTVPNGGFVYREMYYWDSYFTIVGLLAMGKVELAKGIVDNIIFLINRFGMMPNASRLYMLSRSQPPLLTLMIREIAAATNDREWMQSALMIARTEYETVWMSSEQPHNRNVHAGLSRYYDINVLHDLAEAESGWDYTPRFANHCLDFLPVDLNSFLYLYEIDFAQTADDQDEARMWSERAAQRQSRMRLHMYSSEAGLYLDFDYVNYEHSESHSLASYAPLFTGLATDEEAAAAVSRLRWFETKYGLSTTQMNQGMHIGKQWAHPNGWAPLQYMVIVGLERYGYHAKARQLARTWVKTNLRVFEKTGAFYEKYNVVEGNQHVLEGVYPSQQGFAWTNGVFAALAHHYILVD